MKRILTFEFDEEDYESYNIVAKCLNTAKAVIKFDQWLRSRVEYGFDAHELKSFEGLTSEGCIDRTIEMARDTLHDCLGEI